MSQWDYIWMGLVIGAGSFGHCLGMCGAFPLHLSAGPAAASPGQAGVGVWANLARQLPWHAGRIVTYVFLGALAGYFGGIIGAPERPWVQKGLTWLAGAAMVLAGMAMVGLLPKRAKVWRPGRGEGLFALVFRQLFARPTPAGAMVLGLACGFLPCGIIWAALSLSINSRSVPVGMATMAALGVGTIWSLLVLGLTGGMMRQALRRWATLVAGVILIAMGVVTVLRGSGVMKEIMPHGQMPAATAPSGATSMPATEPECCH